jgi:hypothetical protein
MNLSFRHGSAGNCKCTLQQPLSATPAKYGKWLKQRVPTPRGIWFVNVTMLTKKQKTTVHLLASDEATARENRQRTTALLWHSGLENLRSLIILPFTMRQLVLHPSTTEATSNNTEVNDYATIHACALSTDEPCFYYPHPPCTVLSFKLAASAD